MEYAMTYFDYDRLSDDLLFLGNSMVLRLNVTLGKVDQRNGNRMHFHREYAYPTNKYNDINKVITLRRSFGYYLSLEKLDMREMSVMIRVQDILLLRAKVNEVLTWFNGNVFGTKNKRLYVINKPQPAIVSGLAEAKTIIFEPIVIEWEETGIQQQGIRITLTEGSAYADISIDNFYGFAYIINTINMFESAQLMVNYLGRPEFGSNLLDFEENTFLSDNKPARHKPESQFKNRDIPQKPKSFFDKIDKLGG